MNLEQMTLMSTIVLVSESNEMITRAADHRKAMQDVVKQAPELTPLELAQLEGTKSLMELEAANNSLLRAIVVLLRNISDNLKIPTTEDEGVLDEDTVRKFIDMMDGDQSDG